MKGIAKACQEMTTYSIVRVQLTEKRYVALKNLVDEGWVSCEVKFSADNQLVLYLSIGETLRQGKVLVSADTDLEVLAELTEKNVADLVGGSVKDGADSGDGMEG